MNKVIFTIAVLKTLILSPVLGQFSSPTLIDTNTTQITNIITADINNDNLKDIIVTRKFSASIISYYLNLGNSLFGPETIISTGFTHFTKIASGDFNKDGWKDLVSIGDDLNTVILYTNNQTHFTATTIDTLVFFDSDIQTADIDNDSDLDIIVVAQSTLKIYYNDGLSNFTSQTIAGPIEDFFDLTINDIDGDGFKDILTGGLNISVYKNTNGLIHYDSARLSTIPSSGNIFLELVDLDMDGDFDLFSAANENMGIRWMKNDGNGYFSNLQMIDTNPPNTRYGASIKDFDKDGDLDIILPKDFNFVRYTNNGSGNFDTATVIHPGTPFSITVLHSDDMNNDGKFDAIWSSNLSIQLNNSTPVSITESEDDNLIELYPNPASNKVSIFTPSPGKLTFYNSVGQIALKNIDLHKGTNHLELNLPPQIYFLTIQSKNKTHTKKLIIE